MKQQLSKNSLFFKIMVFTSLIGTVNSQSWVIPEYVPIYVSVHNPHEEKSPTGRDLVQSWGDAKYNYNRDQIEWTDAKK